MNKTVERTIEILKYFAEIEQEGGIGISQIAREFDMPKSSASDLLYSLLELNFLQYDNCQIKTFRLGSKAIQFGICAMGKYEFLKIAQPELENLYRECGYTVYAGVENGDRMMIVSKIEGSSAVKFADGVGSTKPRHLTAIGKVLLAGYSDDGIIDILGDTCYEVHTKNSAVNPRQVLAEIAKVRHQGFAIENFEENDYTYGIAAPVFDMNGSVCAGVGISVFSADISAEQIPELVKAVCATAKRISRDMGGGAYSYADCGGCKQ